MFLSIIIRWHNVPLSVFPPNVQRLQPAHFLPFLILLSPYLLYHPPKGNIAVEGGEPTITCKFHNSKFELATGKCTAWSESVFGIKGTEGIAGFVGGFGGAKDSPATVFPVLTSEEGLVSIEV